MAGGAAGSSPSAAPVPWRLPLLLTALVVLAQLLAVFNPAVVEVDPEEMVNASHAWTVAREGLTYLFPLQYRPFCGGCSATALLGAGLFTVLPPSWLTWKLLPLGLTGLLALAGQRALWRHVGPAAAVAFALLLLFPPRAWLHLSLIAWGNHYEAGVIVLLAALLAARREPRAGLGAGLLLALALWVGFSAAFALPAILGWLALRGRWRHLGLALLGLLAVLLPWGLQWALAGSTPFDGIYEAGEAAPRLSRLPGKLANLLHPRQAAAMFGLREHTWGQLLGPLAALAAVAGVALGAWRRVPLAGLAGLLALAWTGVYVLVRFEMGLPPAPEVAVPGTVRYAAPLYPALFLGVSATCGALWQAGRRLSAVAILGPLLLAGLAARILALQAPFPTPQAASLSALNHEYFRVQASWQLDAAGMLPEELPAEAAPGRDPWSAELLAYARGWRSATAHLRDEPDPTELLVPASGEASWWQGVGAALAEQLDPAGQGGLDYLLAAAAWLDARIPEGARTDGHRLALRQAAWARREAPHALQRATDAHDASSFRALDRALDGADPRVADAVGWAAGRRWAADVTPWLVPQDPALPEDLPAHHTAFAEGLGHGQGERWGPRVAPPRPLGLPGTWVEPWQRGYEAGTRRRWLSAPPATASPP